jgi:uncharacterized protein YbaR (Trm112 family)
MPPDSFTASELGIYACPACKRLLCREEAEFRCPACSKAYPIRETIPDFILEELSRSADPELRRMRFIDRMARIYESQVVVSDGSKYLWWISQPISGTADQYRVSESPIDQGTGAGYRVRPRHLRAAGCITVEGSVRNRRIHGNAAARRSLCGAGRHPQCAFRSRTSGGSPFRRWPFRRRPLLWLASSLHGYGDCFARDGSRHETSGNSFRVYFRRRPQRSPSVSECAGVESYTSRPSCIRSSADGALLDGYRLYGFPARSIRLHFDVQRPQASGLTGGARAKRKSGN